MGIEQQGLVAQVGPLIRAIPGFPKPGIVFRDITPLLADGPGFARTVDYFAELCHDQAWQPDLIIAPEARGFIFGAALAFRLGIGFVPVRKPNKLPYTTRREEYALEYGIDALEMHIDAVAAHHRVVLIDDLLATGGTMAACARLLKAHEVNVQAALFVIELIGLGGRAALGSVPVHRLLEFPA